MLLKKLYIPIGILILVICAVSFLSLRSDTPTESITIYKATTPAEVSTTPETATSNTAEEEKARLMQRLAEAEAKTKEAEAITKEAEAITKEAEAITKEVRDKLKALKAKD